MMHLTPIAQEQEAIMAVKRFFADRYDGPDGEPRRVDVVTYADHLAELARLKANARERVAELVRISAHNPHDTYLPWDEIPETAREYFRSAADRILAVIFGE